MNEINNQISVGTFHEAGHRFHPSFNIELLKNIKNIDSQIESSLCHGGNERC